MLPALRTPRDAAAAAALPRCLAWLHHCQRDETGAPALTIKERAAALCALASLALSLDAASPCAAAAAVATGTSGGGVVGGRRDHASHATLFIRGRGVAMLTETIAAAGGVEAAADAGAPIILRCVAALQAYIFSAPEASAAAPRACFARRVLCRAVIVGEASPDDSNWSHCTRHKTNESPNAQPMAITRDLRGD